MGWDCEEHDEIYDDYDDPCIYPDPISSLFMGLVIALVCLIVVQGRV